MAPALSKIPGTWPPTDPPTELAADPSWTEPTSFVVDIGVASFASFNR